jgi:hypothetical protein
MIEAMIIIAVLAAIIWIFAKHSVSLCDCGCLGHTFITYESLKKRVCIDCGFEEKL